MNANICPICQSSIPERAPGGLCPVCVLRDAEIPEATGKSAPSMGDVSAAFPQFEIKEFIGQGGMGFVYRVRQPGLDRIVALKILSPDLGHDPAFAERFSREARALAKLNHPNIVHVFEHGESGGFFYLLMEFVDGVNLRQAMRAGRFTPEQALAIVPGICDALQAAHAQGIWHRDIKPENILLDPAGNVKIVDFGIARIAGDPQHNFTLTVTGNVLGSAAYMSPEQHEKPHDIDHRADIYSLGVVIYEMLTGELPLGRFPAPSERATVNARIDEIVMRTLEKERELRQQSANEVKTDVQGAGDKLSRRSIRPVTPSGRFGKLALAMLVGGILIPILILLIDPWLSLSRFVPVKVELPATLCAVALVLALVIGFMARKERAGKIAWIGSLLILGIGVPAIAVDHYKDRQAAGLATEAAALHATRVRFTFSHPEASAITFMDIPTRGPFFGPSEWMPGRGGQRIPLKEGKSVWVRARLLENLTGIDEVIASCSTDGVNWEIQGTSVSPENPKQEVRFTNGTIATITLFQNGVPIWNTRGDQSSVVRTIERTMESMIKAAKEKDEDRFRRGTTADLLSKTPHLSEMMQRWERLSYGYVESIEGDSAVVWLHENSTTTPEGVAFQSSSSFTLVREDDEWKFTNPLVPQQTRAAKAIKEFLKAARERNTRIFQSRMSQSFMTKFLEECGKHGQDPSKSFGDFPLCQFVELNMVDNETAEAVIEGTATDGKQRKITLRLILEDGDWKVTEHGI
ncbi:MAG: protein kinase [Verrucomicrobiales bacterium]